MKRAAEKERSTKETHIRLNLNIDGTGLSEISTGIPFFDHMLTLTSVHGFFDLVIKADGDVDVDSHHTVEDVGLVFGDALTKALGDRQGIRRFGHAVTPMDDALAAVTVDLSNRPYVVFRLPPVAQARPDFNASLAKEFFRAVASRSGMNLHINVSYGENEHHILEAIFKGFGRAVDQASARDERIAGVRSSKGSL